MNEIATIERTQQQYVYRPSTMLDPDRFKYLWRMAEVIADSSLVPETLRTSGTRNGKVDLPRERVLANCFLVVEQADRWDMSPFACISCASVVHGRLGWEGKLIAAVLEAKLGVRLDYRWDDGAGDSLRIVVSGTRPGETEPRTVTGTVAEWKTSGEGTPWTPKNFRKMLAYRGAREWGRLWAPSLMLGVLGDDEVAEIGYEARAAQARDVTSSLGAKLAAAADARGAGFDASGIQRQIADAPGIPMDSVRDHIIETVNVATGEISNSKPAVSSGQDSPGGAAQEHETIKTETSTGTGSGLNTGKGDENSPTESQIAADPPAPQQTASNDASSAERGAGPDGSAVPPSGAAVSYPYGDYARALARASQEKSLKSFDEQFRLKASWTTEEDAKPTLREIFITHRKKLRGEMTPAAFMAELKKLGAAA